MAVSPLEPLLNVRIFHPEHFVSLACTAQPRTFSFPIRSLKSPFSSITSLDCTKFYSVAKRSTLVEMAAIEKGNEEGKRKVKVFESEEDLALSLANYTSELSKKVTAERGAFTVVLSGGSLIKTLRKLLEPPYFDLVDWGKWHVFWVDERVVPKDHEDSNYKLAYDGLLSKAPIPADQVYAINDALSAEGAAEDYETRLKSLLANKVLRQSEVTSFPKFDLMLLGMGPDGHIASLFPDHPLVKETKKWVTFIKDSPKPPPERITFTFPMINSSSYIALVVVGNGKANAVHDALVDGRKLPVQMVSPEEEIAWFLDKGAASMLK